MGWWVSWLDSEFWGSGLGVGGLLGGFLLRVNQLVSY